MMKDAYSFHRDESDFQNEYQKMWRTYEKIFKRVGLEAVVAESDNGYIGGDYCHEFVVESEVGESKVLSTEDNSYTAHQDVAKFWREDMNLAEKTLPIQEVEAKRGPSIDDGVEFYGQPSWRQIKTVIYKTNEGEFVLAAIRGDLDINETKLSHVLGCLSVEAASPEEIAKIGSAVGFVSPLHLSIKKVGDLSLKTVKNFITGADKYQRDTINVNYGRDFTVDIEADVGLAKSGYKSETGKLLRELVGVEVGNIFQLGEYYSSKMSATYMDEDGKSKFYYMGCYGIGVGRVMATVAERYHDEKGLVWPNSIAPFSVHLISLCREGENLAKADALYDVLGKNGFDVLYDDRPNARAGEKFADSDLIGIPLRIVISEKTLKQNCVELKKRASDGFELIDLNNLMARLKD
jgi:prolyl-tRNA synthetase